jgi:hypothetical protein
MAGRRMAESGIQDRKKRSTQKMGLQDDSIRIQTRRTEISERSGIPGSDRRIDGKRGIRYGKSDSIRIGREERRPVGKWRHDNSRNARRDVRKPDEGGMSAGRARKRTRGSRGRSEPSGRGHEGKRRRDDLTWRNSTRNPRGTSRTAQQGM